MKALKLRISDELYERFKALHPAYGEESQVFRELLETYVQQQEKGVVGTSQHIKYQEEERPSVWDAACKM